MAASLIDSMTSDFDADAHHDGYREALIEVVEAKIQGRELTQPSPLEIAAGPSTSLADALKASLAAAQQSAGAGEDRGEAKAIADASTGSRASKARAAKTSSAKAGSGKASAGHADAGESGADERTPARGKAGAKPRKAGTGRPTRKAS